MSNVSRFVLASSISAYEWYQLPSSIHRITFLSTRNTRAVRKTCSTKHIQEHLVTTYYHQYGVPTTVVRLTAVVGPHGKGGGRGWRTFAEGLAGGEQVRVPHLTAEEVCHYVDVRDVARMFLVASEHPRAVGEIFNCCGLAKLGREFIEIVQRFLPESRWK
jgi:nucleoside-diphosphate-sugar epimerase